MCGINGLFSQQLKPENWTRDINIMNESLQHRGPDGSGVWHDQKSVCFGHRRLAILDLSPNGHQPMLSRHNRFVITFNGEIYNFSQLRKELLNRGATFRGHSDTEVMLEMFEQYGVPASLKKFHGMFALAVWNLENRKLYLARDRAGEKPLYYALINGMLLFSSELKAFLELKSYRFEIDRESLSYYFKYNYIPAPRTIFKNIKKLPAGTLVTASEPQDLFSQEPTPYWTLPQTTSDQIPIDEASTLSKLENLLLQTIKSELVADVPVGVFLSGGVDSSLITALARSHGPVHTFSIGFHEADYDESARAEAIARHLNTQHTTWKVQSSDIKKMIPNVATMYDEPFADSSQLPTALLAQLTRKKVTVALSGDGGDEVFGGYNRYLWLKKINQDYLEQPVWLRKVTPLLLSGWGEKTLIQILRLKSKVNGSTSIAHPAHKVAKLREVLSAKSRPELFDRTISHLSDPRDILVEGLPVSLASKDWGTGDSFVRGMMDHDFHHYLPDDILVKVDRATMYSSLESRAPFLDHAIVEFARGLPISLLIKNGESKWLLKQLLHKYVPSTYFSNAKQGFSVPLDLWFQTDLRDWLCDLTSPQQLKKLGILNEKKVQLMVQEHLRGQRLWHSQLWNIAVFQSWASRWLT